jgi:hypothetical protein
VLHLKKLKNDLRIGVWSPASTINFLSNEDTSGLAPRYFISSINIRAGNSKKGPHDF